MFDDTQHPQSTPETNKVAPVEGAPTAPAAPTEQPQQPQPPVAPKAPAAIPLKTTQEERMWSAIGYIAFLGVVTLAMMPKSEFCKKHAQQGILLFVFWFIGLILLAFPISILSGIGGLIIVASTVIAILGIVKSISSYELKLPVLSDLAKMVPAEAIVGSLTGKATKGTEPTPTPVPTPTEEPKKEEEPPAPTETPVEPPVETPAEEKPQEPQTPQQQ